MLFDFKNSLLVRMLRPLVATVLVVGIILFVANLLIDNPYTQALARQLINQQIKKFVNLKFEYQAVRIQLLPIEMSIFGVQVSDASNRESRLVKASSIRIGLSFMSIVRGAPRLGSVEGSEVEFSWPLHPDLQKVLGLDKPSDEPFTWPLQISQLPLEAIVLRNSRVAIVLPPEAGKANAKLDTTLVGINARIDVADMRDIGVQIGIDQAELHADKFNVLQRAHIDMSCRIVRNEIRSGIIKASDEDADASGTFTGTLNTEPTSKELIGIELNGKAAANADLALLGRVLNIDGTAGPSIAEGKWLLYIPTTDSPKNNAKMKFNLNAQTKSARMDDFLINDASADLEIDLDRIQFSNGRAVVNNKDIAKFSGNLGFNERIDFSFDASLDKLMFRDLMRSLKVDFSVFDAKISSSNLHIEGTGEPFNLQATAVADFEQFHFPVLRDKLKTSESSDPTCRVSLDIKVNTSQLLFGANKMLCFHPKESASLTLAQVPTRFNAPIDAIGASNLGVSGFISFNNKRGLDVNVDSSDLDLSVVSNWIAKKLAGRSGFNLRIHGPYDDIMMDGKASCGSCMIDQLQLTKLETNFKVTDNNKLTWSNLSTEMAEGSIKSTEGWLRFDTGLNFDTKLDASELGSLTMQQIFGVIGLKNIKLKVPHFRGAVRGELFKPLAYGGNFDFNLQELIIGDDTYFDQLAGSISTEGSKLKSNSIRARLKDLNANLTLEVDRATHSSYAEGIFGDLGWKALDQYRIQFALETPPAPEINANTKTGMVAFDHLNILPMIRPYAKMAQLSGQIRGSGRISGTLDKTNASWQLTLQQIRFLKSRIAPVNIDGDWQNQRMHVAITHANNNLKGVIDIDTSKNTLPYEWDFKANRLDIRSLGSKLFANDPRNFAYLTARSRAKGQLTNWWKSQGTIDFSELRVRLLRDTRTDVAMIDLHNKENLRLIMDPNGWSFAEKKNFSLENDQMAFKVAFTENRPPEKLGLAINGWFEIDAFRTLIPQLEMASGVVEISGKIGGSVEQPQIELRATDNRQKGGPIALGFTPIRPPFSNVRFDVSLRNNILTIQSLTADKGKGRVNATGQLVIGNSTSDSSRLDINFQNATFLSQVAVLKTFESELSGSISLTGNKFPFLLAGDIKIERARSTKNFDLRDQIIEALKRRTFQSASANINAEPALTFDLRINASESIAIYNRNIQADLSSNLTLTGSDIAPIVGGQVEVNKGMFAYKYRRDFRITQGIVTFDDPIRPDPRLDILAVSETAGYRVYMALTGRASDPRVDLSIDPPTNDEGVPLTKVDILVLLSTGSLPKKQRADVATQDVAKAEALNLLVGQFEEPVEKLFDMSGQTVIQQIFIDSYAGPDGTPTARLNMPLNIHPDWDFILRADNNTQKLTVGYKVDDNVSLSGSVDRQNKSDTSRQSSQNDPTDTGVDLKFRFSFP